MKASEAQISQFGGKVVWRCIRDVQRGRRGLVPVRMKKMMDEEENACNIPEQQKQRWRRHFAKFLNIESELD